MPRCAAVGIGRSHQFRGCHRPGCGYLAGLADGIMTTSRASQLARHSVAPPEDHDSDRDSYHRDTYRDSDHLPGSAVRNSAVLPDRDTDRDSDHLPGVSEASGSKESSGLCVADAAEEDAHEDATEPTPPNVANAAREDAEGDETEPTPPLPTELPVLPPMAPSAPPPVPPLAPVRHVSADASPAVAAASGAVDAERAARRQAGAVAVATAPPAAAAEAAATGTVVTATAESKAAVATASRMAARTARLRGRRPSEETMTLLRQRYGDA